MVATRSRPPVKPTHWRTVFPSNDIISPLRTFVTLGMERLPVRGSVQCPLRAANLFLAGSIARGRMAFADGRYCEDNEYMP